MVYNLNPSGNSDSEVPSGTNLKSVMVYVGALVLKIGTTLFPIAGSPTARTLIRIVTTPSNSIFINLIGIGNELNAPDR